MGGGDRLIGRMAPACDLVSDMTRFITNAAQRAATLSEGIVLYDGPPFPKGTPPPAPPGFHKMTRVSRAVHEAAEEFKDQGIHHMGLPVGSRMPIEIEGKTYIFLVDWHKHPETDKVSPGLKRWHPGVTVCE